jgi:hypothetical protein
MEYGDDWKSGGVTGGAANGEVLIGGAANVLGGAAGIGWAAAGYCAVAALYVSSVHARPAMSREVRFTGVAAQVNGAGKSAQLGRGRW